jgi:hypothetical protein
MDEAQDVQPVEITTDSPSTIEETPVNEVEVQTPETTELEAEKTVPYERFSEINNKYRETESTLSQMQAKIAELEGRAAPQFNQPQVAPEVQEAKEQLKQLLKEVGPELGYVSREELQRQEEDKALNSEFARLESKWDGKTDPSLKFDRKSVREFAIKNQIYNPEMAFKLLKEKELANYYVRQAQAKAQGLKTEGSDGSGSQSTGTSNDDLRAAATKGDQDALHLLLKRVSSGK